MLIMAKLDNFCLLKLINMEQFVMARLLEFEYFHEDRSIDLRYFRHDVVNIDPCESTLQALYIFSSPSVSYDLNLK